MSERHSEQLDWTEIYTGEDGERRAIPIMQTEWSSKCRAYNKRASAQDQAKHAAHRCRCTWKIVYHTHGALAGHRSAHCGPRFDERGRGTAEVGKYESTGYMLKAPVEERGERR